MTWKDLEDRLLEHFNYDSSLATSDARSRMRRHLNTWHRRILSNPMFSGLADATDTFASVASQANYTLREAPAKVLRIYEKTNDVVLESRSLEWYRRVEPDPQAGTPDVWVPLGYGAVYAQPAGTGLWVASSSAADITQTVYVAGHVSGGYSAGGTAQTITATLNGVTKVQMGSAVLWKGVSRFYLSAAGAGTVYLYGDAAGTICYGDIPPLRLFSRYYTFALWPTPSAVITYYYDYRRKVDDVTIYAADEPLLPEDFHDLLELGARIEEYEKENDMTRAASAQRLYALRMRDLVHDLHITPGYVGIPGEIQGTSRSRLGPYFPAGS